MGNGDVTADQLGRVCDRLDNIVNRLDDFIGEVRSDINDLKANYVLESNHLRDLALLENKLDDTKKDLGATKATLSKVLFLVVGAIVTIVTALVVGAVQAP